MSCAYLRSEVDDQHGALARLGMFCQRLFSVGMAWVKDECSARECSSASSRVFRYARTSRATRTSKEERQERDDAAQSQEQEAQELPAHQAPHPEAREEIHDVEPAVRDQDAEREVQTVTGRLVSVRALHDRREPEEAARTAEEQLVPERVLDEHLGAQQQQHRAGDHRADLVELQRPADGRERGEFRGRRHAPSLPAAREAPGGSGS